MITSPLPIYFSAANSAEGFISFFKSTYNNDYRVYLIKGGPGTGKSTFMKKIAQECVKRGYRPELIICSSDPESLDGILIREINTAFFDATSPHILEPVFPGVSEQIIDFGQFWDRQKLINHKTQIIALTKENKSLHKKASAVIGAMGELMRNNIRISLLATNLQRTFDFSVKLADRYLPDCKKAGCEQSVCLKGLTNEGEIDLGSEINKLVSKTVVINDPFNTVSSIIFSVIRDIAINRGYAILTVKNNILPDEIIEGIIVPEMDLAFALDRKEDGVRKIHSSRFMDREIIKKNRGKINFNKRLIKELSTSAVSFLKEAKECHDKLEEKYKSAVDYGEIEKFTKNFLINTL